MLIGGLIGFVVAMVLAQITITFGQIRAKRANNSLAARIRGIRYEYTINPIRMVINAFTLTAIGALVGYFM